MVSVNSWGTFDISNFGDLLFPLILKRELEKRLGEVSVTLSSPRGGPFPADPAQSVHRIIRLEESAFFSQALHHDGLVLGGGDIVRLDDSALAGLYNTSLDEASASRFMRVFTFDLGLLARVTPVFWNAVGVPHDFAPDEYERVRKSLKAVRYLSVRDETSRKRLEAAGVDRDVRVVPDSSFLLGELFPKKGLDPAIKELIACGLFPASGKIFTVQVSFATEAVVGSLSEVLLRLVEDDPDLNVVLLPIGLDHGDLGLLGRLHGSMGRRCHLVRKRVTLVDVAAVIAHSTLFAGTSLHGNIAAYVYGVKNIFICVPPYAPSKLIECARLLRRDKYVADSLEALLRLSREQLEQEAEAGGHGSESRRLGGQGKCECGRCEHILEQVSAHFDYLASEIQAGASRTWCADLSKLSELHAEMAKFFSEEVARRVHEARALSSRLSTLESIAAESQSELAQIKATTAWRWLSRYGALKHRYLLPLMRRFGAGRGNDHSPY